MTAAVKMVDQSAAAATLLHPLRLRLLEQLGEPDSSTGLARKLGLPRQKVNYHLRELERAGFVEFVAERRKGNCNERLVRAVATAYLINPSAVGTLAADPDRIPDRFSSAYLVALASRAIQELAILQDWAERDEKRLPTLSLQSDVRFASAAARTAFAEELTNCVARLVAKYHDAAASDGRLFRFFVGGYPAITKPPPSTADAKAAQHKTACTPEREAPASGTANGPPGQVDAPDSSEDLP